MNLDFSKLDYNRILQGMIRAARLDKTFYEEVEHDTSYTQDALAIVLLVSLVGALGSFLSLVISGSFIGAIVMFILSAVINVAVFFLWVYVAQYVGTHFFKGTGDVGEVQRALGFAYAPRVLSILSFIPCAGALLSLVIAIWSIATGYIAIRQSLDQDNQNAILTAVVSGVICFLVQLAVMAVVGAIVAMIGLAGAAATGALR